MNNNPNIKRLLSDSYHDYLLGFLRKQIENEKKEEPIKLNNKIT